MVQERPRQRGCILLVVCITLAIILSCAAIPSIISSLQLGPPDALSKLKSLPVYPGTGSITFRDNTKREMVGTQIWVFKSGGIVGSDMDRNLNEATAGLTFETVDEPDQVQQFYAVVASKRGYNEIESKVPGNQYIGWEESFETIAYAMEPFRGDEMDRPFSFHHLSINADKVLPLSGDKNAVTRVSVELSILNETGGLR